MLGHGARVLKVYILLCDLDVEQSSFNVRVPHELHERGQADTGPHHIGSERVPKPMRVGEFDASSLAMVAE